MTVVLVEGESDAAALEVVARRLGAPSPSVVVTGGSKSARRAAEEHAGERVLGLVDERELRDVAPFVDEVFVCRPDLEGELITALGVDGVEAVIAAAGELDSFRSLQRQPAQRSRTAEVQLSRFFGGRSGNKLRYARLLAEAVSIERMPAPLVGIVRSATNAG